MGGKAVSASQQWPGRAAGAGLRSRTVHDAPPVWGWGGSVSALLQPIGISMRLEFIDEVGTWTIYFIVAATTAAPCLLCRD